MDERNEGDKCFFCLIFQGDFNPFPLCHVIDIKSSFFVHNGKASSVVGASHSLRAAPFTQPPLISLGLIFLLINLNANYQ